MIKINGKKFETTEVIKVEIENKTYSLPLMKHLKYKTLKKLLSMKDESDDDLEMITEEVLGEYIPVEVLDELSVAEITQIITTWKEVSGGEDLGN